MSPEQKYVASLLSVGVLLEARKLREKKVVPDLSGECEQSTGAFVLRKVAPEKNTGKNAPRKVGRKKNAA